MTLPRRSTLLVLVLIGTFGASLPIDAQDRQSRTVRARVQARPGGPVEDVEMRVREVPVDPTTVPADQVDLEDDELILGLVVGGRPIAYPIRFLAMFEVVNDRVGDTPLAPTW